MEIWLDTASVQEIRKWSWFADGVTTNPSLISGESGGFRETIGNIIKSVKGCISVEVTSEDCEGMVSQAREFSRWAPNIVVKIPMTEEGMKAVKVLCSMGIKTNVTLVFSLPQAMAAAGCGATFVSPFAGRVDDHIRKKAGLSFEKSDYFPMEGIGHSDDGTVSGVDLVRRIITAYRNYGMKTRVVAASIRNRRQAAELVSAGADILTVPPEVLADMFRHEKTDEGLEIFRKDWSRVKK
jgi:transaldolase